MIFDPVIQKNVERIVLGKSDIQISPLGIGTWQWGDRLVWGYGKGEYSDDTLNEGYLESLRCGINFFDSAETYGNGTSEKLLGRFSRAAGIPVVIATKFMPYPYRLRKSNLIDALKESLTRLQVSRVDLYQIHHPIPPVPVATWAAGMADAVEMGLTRTVGVSNYSRDKMLRAYEVLEKRDIHLASNQVVYSLANRGIERSGLLKTCQELMITVIAYSPLGQGLLTGRYSAEHPMPGFRGYRYAGLIKRIQPLLDLLMKIGQAHDGKTPAQVALNWVICKGVVPIPGIKNALHAQGNAGAMGWRLTADEVATLDSASDKIS